MGILFQLAAQAGTRAFGLGLTIAIWLIGRPGGWAVLCAAILLALHSRPDGP